RVDRSQTTGFDTGDCLAGNYLVTFPSLRLCDPAGHIPPNDPSATTMADDFSLGLTSLTPPTIDDTTPLPFESMFGDFLAHADPSLAGTPVSYPVSLATDTVPYSPNVNGGMLISGVAPGRHTATWKVTDLNGDTYTLDTKFVQQPGTPGPPGPAGSTGA